MLPAPPAPPKPLLPESHPMWVHPQANRELVLHGQRVGFWLRRGQRKTIGLSIDAQGLRVSLPRWSPLAAADEVVQAKAAWVLSKLALVAQQHAAQHSARPTWAEGDRLAWQGGWLHLRLGAAPQADHAQPPLPSHPSHPAASAPPAGAGAAAANTSLAGARPRRTAPRVQAVGHELWLDLPVGAADAQRREAARAWAAQMAHAHCVQRLNHFAPQLQVRWNRLLLTNAATRWGSAKSDGTIRLHWRLMQMAPEVLDYVVVHELAHLRHMDHSPRFWGVVASVLPDHAALRARLRSERLPPW